MLSNTAVPKYYGAFRDAVIRGEIPVCKEIDMEMHRIDDLIDDPMYYYDDKAVDGWVEFCESELTLTDGSNFHMLDSFKLWGEQVFGWYYFETRSVYTPNPDGHGGRYVNKKIKKRLVNKQYLIVGRGAAKSLYDSCIQAYSLVVDGSTTHQITTAPTMKQAEEIINPIKTAITRAHGPVFQFMTEGSIQNTTGNLVNRVKLRKLLEDVKAWLAAVGLKLKSNWQIFRVGFTPRVEKLHKALSKKKQRHRRPRMPSALGYRFGRGYTILRKHNLFRLKQALHLYYYRRDRNRVISFKRASGLISRLGQLRKCNSHRILERFYQSKTMHDLKNVVRKECRRLQALYPPYVAA